MVHRKNICNMCCNIGLLIFILLISYSAFSAKNIEQKQSDPLLRSCQIFISDSEHVNALPCIYYIRGLLAGAWDVNKLIATDKKSPHNKSKPLTWSQRAYRTRVGNRADREKPKGHTYYCSPNNELHVAILELLIKHPLPRVNSVQGIHNWAFDALKKICTELDKS